MTQVVVIDYGMGNLHSVSKAVQAVSSSESIVISSDKDVIKAADKLVFPGVGAIKDCMDAFSVDLRETVLEEIHKKPTLAICVGMQMLLKSSEENGGVDCFDILDGKVTKIKALILVTLPSNISKQSTPPFSSLDLRSICIPTQIAKVGFL